MAESSTPGGLAGMLFVAFFALGGPAMIFAWIKLVLRGTSFWSFFWFHLLTFGTALLVSSTSMFTVRPDWSWEGFLLGMAGLTAFCLIGANGSASWSRRAQG